MSPVAKSHHESLCAQQVPQSAIGSIIGSGGSNINRIRQETGAKIKVFDEPVRDALTLLSHACRVVDIVDPWVVEHSVAQRCNTGLALPGTPCISSGHSRLDT